MATEILLDETGADLLDERSVELLGVDFATPDILDETGSAITDENSQDLAQEQPYAFVMSASTNIAASGENTTAQLSSPGGSFAAGRIQDDENPADAVDIGSGGYTEMEWCVKATDDAEDDWTYPFRVTAAGTALDLYTVTPEWTIGSAPTLVTPSVASSAGTAPAGVFTLAQTPAVASPAAVASLVYALSQIPGVAAGVASASAVWARLQTPERADAAASALFGAVSIGTVVIPDAAAGAGGASVLWTLAQTPGRADLAALASVLFTLGQVPTRADGVALATALYELAQTPGRAEGSVSAPGASALVATVVVPAAAIGTGTALSAFALALTGLAQALGSAEAPVYALVQVPARAEAVGTGSTTFLLRIGPDFAAALASALGATAVADLPGEPTFLAQVRIELFSLPPVLRVAGAPDAALVAAGAPALRLRDGPDAAEAIPGDAGGRVMP
ncbi:MAG: hypothetical protein ACHQ1G_00015 [Planctomycetota bacterium]